MKRYHRAGYFPTMYQKWSYIIHTYIWKEEDVRTFPV